MFPLTEALTRRASLPVCALSCVVAIGLLAGSALASGDTVIRMTTKGGLGNILAGPAGYTLYVLCVGAQTQCTGTRSKSFTPLIAHGRVVPAPRSGIKASELGTRKLSGRQRQVTYYRQPLYLYKCDHKPGMTNGEEKGNSQGRWFVITTGGRAMPKGGY